MRIKILLLTLILSGTALYGQQIHTLFDDESVSLGGYFAPVLKYGIFSDEAGIMIGGKGAMVLNHRFTLGGGGYFLIGDVEHQQSPSSRYRYLNLAYGGLELGYVHEWDEVVHATFNVLLGHGGVGYRRGIWNEIIDGNFSDDDIFDDEVDNFFILEPSISVNLNLTRWLHLSAGASYRLVTDVDLPGLQNEDLRGISLQTAIEFGLF
jgi:hypothetical protein